MRTLVLALLVGTSPTALANGQQACLSLQSQKAAYAWCRAVYGSYGECRSAGSGDAPTYCKALAGSAGDCDRLSDSKVTHQRRWGAA